MFLKKQWLSSRQQKRVAKFGPKFGRPLKVLEVVNNNLVVDVDGERMTVNLDQVRVYKCREDSEASEMLSTNFQLSPSRESAGDYSSSCTKNSFHPCKELCAKIEIPLPTPAKTFSNGNSD